MDHEHCQGCVRSSCTECSYCPVEYCKNGCGFSLHRCKWAEHNEHTCPEALVSCCNAALGCVEQLTRKNLGPHLLHCPASTIQCRFAYNRRIISTASGECVLHAMGDFIDEKLLSGDLGLIMKNSQDPPPTLAVSMENCSYAKLQRRTEDDAGDWGEVSTERGRCSYTPEHQSNLRSFYCNEIIRRDEFVPHWNRFHLEIQLNMDLVVQRCPLLKYGCTHGRDNLVPTPSGATLNYDSEGDSFLATVPTSISLNSDEEAGVQVSQYKAKIQEKKELSLYGYGEEESYDVLGQLPIEVLLSIIQYLDSISLWNMAMVNHYIRKVCFEVVWKKGIVYFKWEKEVDITCLLGFKWVQSPKVIQYLCSLFRRYCRYYNTLL